ncbi:pickpocket protein 28-like [Haematobia irritans]|uniref:pickpocket protein 28-like n=1 Tax=Haematobia irritans TaxID=7368 RepID=UPI003F5068EF
MSQESDNPRPGLCLRLIIYYMDILKQFLSSTALNGLKYLSFKYLIFWEKLFFLICFVAAAYNSFNFAINIIEKWQTSPVIIIVNPQATIITNEPFPSVTICNMNRASKRKVENFPINSTDYAMTSKICFQELNYTAYSVANFHKTNDTFANFLVRNAQPCSDMIALCLWDQTETTCTDLFRPVLLDEGICCSFNIAHPFLIYNGDYSMPRDFTSIDSQWIPVDYHPENGYPKDLPKRFYPRKAIGSGITNGLSLVLNGDIDDYYCSSTNGAGFKVQLHNPIDAPQIKETGLTISLGYQTSFRVSAIKDEAQPTLRSTSPKERQCYFSDERPLHYYKYYTRPNCESECDAYFFLRTCNCIPYYLPKVLANATTCYIEHFDCQVQAEKDYSDPENIQCKRECLSGCYDISFTPDIFPTPFATDNFGLVNSFMRNFTREYINSNFAYINIYFPQNFYRSNVKTPYTGITEYLSQTGGIMSLMIGFSVISIVEFVYFFIVKPLIHLSQRCFHKNIVNIKQLAAKTNLEEE